MPLRSSGGRSILFVDDGLIEESNERPVPELDDERRHYYRLTPFGLRVARAEAQRLAALVQMCALVGYTLVQRVSLVAVGLAVATLLVAVGGFGGLLVHHAATFLVFLTAILRGLRN